MRVTAPEARRHRGGLADVRHLAASLLQGILLEVERLIVGGNPSIADVHRLGPHGKELIGIQSILAVIFPPGFLPDEGVPMQPKTVDTIRVARPGLFCKRL
jgi:hypothetical protein